MKPLWTSDEICAATQGLTSGVFTVARVVIDSRSIKPGDLFVALRGERLDGHDFVKQALHAGAAAALVDHSVQDIDPDRLIVVGDTTEALEALGKAARKRFHGKVIGVTGSVGKTGTKEMLATAFSACGRTYATQGNLNNHYGVPLSLSNLPRDAEFGIFEMGMNHANELRSLSKFVAPHLSIVTTVEGVHMEFFSGEEAIADAKAEIFDGMNHAGVAILNADNHHFLRLRKHALAAGLDRILSFGTVEHALCRMLSYQVEDMHSRIEAVIADTPMTYRIGAIGKHWGLISVAVLSAVDALGADLPKAAEALELFIEPEGRGRIRELKVAGGHIRLIDDAYNASPASMRAAFEKMLLLKQSEIEPCRTLAVLGDMLELGTASRDLHVGLVPSLINNQVDLVFSAGQFMRQLYDSLPDGLRGGYDATAAGLAPQVVKSLRHRDIVLVKGSNGSRMREVVRAIEENATREEGVDAL